MLTMIIVGPPNTDEYWDALVYILSQYPALNDSGIAGYSFFGPNITYPTFGLSGTGAYYAILYLPAFSPSNTLTSLEATWGSVFSYINTTYPGQFEYFYYNATTYPNFESWYITNNGPHNAGVEELVGSRLLPAEALSGSATALKTALQGSIPPQSVGTAYLVVGKGVSNVVPRGGSDAVNPAWRKAVVHYSESVYVCSFSSYDPKY